MHTECNFPKSKKRENSLVSNAQLEVQALIDPLGAHALCIWFRQAIHRLEEAAANKIGLPMTPHHLSFSRPRDFLRPCCPDS